MSRLLDSNVFITAKSSYYGFDLVPAFWTWIEQEATAGNIASTELVFEELKDGRDELATWVKARKSLIFHVASSSAAVANHVATLGAWAVATGYRQHVIADFMSGADPFLVGAAAEHKHTVVTHETPAGASRKKVKIPDACSRLGVVCENTFDMMRALGARF